MFVSVLREVLREDCLLVFYVKLVIYFFVSVFSELEFRG